MSQKVYTDENILPLFTNKIMKKLLGYKDVTSYASKITGNTIKNTCKVYQTSWYLPKL